MKKLIILVISSLLLSSCTLQFTSTLRTQLENSNVNIQDLQYYNSKRFILQRELTEKDSASISGKIKMKKGKKIEIIKFNRKTPTICSKFTTDTLFMVFEQGKKDSIPFILYADLSSTYILFSPRPISGVKSRPLTMVNYTGYSNIKFYDIIKYEKNDYFYGYSVRPKLLVKKKDVRYALRQVRVAKGARVEVK